MSPDSSPSRLKAIDGALGLHEITASVRQLSYMKRHSKTLLDTLNVKLEITYCKAPVRRQEKGQSYELQRSEKADPAVGERLLEKRIWKGWNFQAVAKHKQPFLGEYCRFIQTYQMPLQGTRKDTRWGRIDLVGASPDSLPVVIELKQKSAKDTPLRMLVEGLAYACAVRKAWNEGGLRAEWAAAMKKHGLFHESAKTLAEVPVILLAPSDFWKRAIGSPGKGTNGKVQEDVWPIFMELVHKCNNHGFPIHFVQFEVETVDEPNIMKVVSVSEVHVPGTMNESQMLKHAGAEEASCASND